MTSRAAAGISASARDQVQILFGGSDLLGRAMVDEKLCVLVAWGVDRGAPLRPPQIIERDVAGNIEDPGLAAAVAAEAGCFLQQLQEDVLDQVLADCGNARQLQAVLIHAAVVALE